MLIQRQEHRSKQEKYRHELEILKQENQEALKTKDNSKQRVSNLQKDLEISKERQSMLENKVVELQDTVTKLSKKGQMHNEIKSHNSAMNKELETLQKVLDKKKREIDNTETNGCFFVMSLEYCLEVLICVHHIRITTEKDKCLMKVEISL